jgi:hypothetical protein
VAGSQGFKGRDGIVNSSLACSPTNPVDVVLLRAQYMAAFERYCAYATKLAEQAGGAEPLPIHVLDAERQTLQEFARTRAALIEALAPVEAPIDARILSDARDEAIRRSIAKRNDPDPAALARKQRLDRRRKRARLIAVATERTGREQHPGHGDQPRAVEGSAVEIAS